MDCVKVALRIRPLVNSELDIGCRSCVERIPKEPQISIGKANQMFTYNYVFDENEGQGKVYDHAVQPMIDNLFKGYNVTILAYGQTGSGKTYTMGTNYNGEGELGVIPRAVYDIFERISTSQDSEFHVTVSFIELYNESLFDLLTNRPREQSIVDIRDHGSGVCIPGLTELQVVSPEQTLERLKEGSIGRVVGSTNMNAQSSRSHAIFTVNIRITPKENTNDVKTSKFHLVDLAGSERSKKTGTTGDRFREGININRGLLMLGNVISQLGDGNHGFINYRDSKLTRLLQDSLGGNSVTLMIACISPADYNQEETLSTLRYADRARKIKNKPVVNQDPMLAELNRLRKENEELRLRMIGDGCPPEHKILQTELSENQKKFNQLSKTLSDVLVQNTTMLEKSLLFETSQNAAKELFTKVVELTEKLSDDDPISAALKTEMAEYKEKVFKLEGEMLGFDKNSESLTNGKDEEEDEADINDGSMAEHIMSQAKMNQEFVTLTKELMCKEELMAKLKENSGQFDQMAGVSRAGFEELKRQLTELQQEKEELLKQIRLNSNTQNASAKIAETRRKRLQELEAKVATLSKKVLEQERVIKMKEKSDEKILKLRQEIMTMKQMKVRLIQQMKSENDRYKSVIQVKNKEVCQLRNQNLKRQHQLKKMEQMHALQQNVLRRKLEAAATANKRIMAALDRQKAAREKRSKVPPNEKIKDRMMEDIELLESEYQAQKSLENLLQDRAALTKELVVVKESLADENVSENEKERLKLDMKDIEQELEVRSAEIADLQQKLYDIRQDDRNKVNWEMLQTMADAKFALNFLYNLLSEKVKENMEKSMTLSDLQDQQSEKDYQLVEYRRKIENLESYYRKTVEKLEKECEDKVCLFLKMLPSENLDKLNELGAFPESFKLNEHIEKLETMRARIEELEAENAKLSSRVNEVAYKDPFQKFLHQKLNSTFTVPADEPKARAKRYTDLGSDTDESLKDCNSSQENAVLDPENDPEWRNSPIHKRLQALKKVKLGKRASIVNAEKCECLESCEKDCVCMKQSGVCSENCPCDKRTCCSTSPKRHRLSRLIDFTSETCSN